MISLRHRQPWLIWLLALILVVTGVLSPAQAFACAEQPAPMAAVQPADHPMDCPDMGQEAACCCKPGERVASLGQELTVAANSAGCGCSVEAPDAPPAPAVKASGLLLPLDIAVLHLTSLSVELPDFKVWQFAAPANGPPLGSFVSSGPSRAPPAL
ncbi:MAG: hypothetical protein ACO1SX_00075 [Actinomycetota bacterium]